MDHLLGHCQNDYVAQPRFPGCVAYCRKKLGVVSGWRGVDFAGDVAAFANFQVTVGDLAGYIAGGLNQQ
jgi:hypothetical protein